MAFGFVAALTAPPAHAQALLSIAWEGCPAAGGTSNTIVSCGDLLAKRDLVCSFTSDVPVDSVIGAELVLDVRIADVGVPDYWKFGIGGCNAGSLLPSFPTPGACADPWGGFGSATITEVYPGVPNGASSERIVVVVTVPAVQARTLDPGVVYDAVQLEFGNGRPCTGCPVPACLVLNSIRLLRLPGAVDVILSGADSAPGNFATWQGGVGADCTSVPTGRRSWGSLKVLYR